MIKGPIKFLLVLLLMISNVNGQKLKLAVGGGLSSFQSPNLYIKEVKDKGFGFGHEFFLGFKVKHSFPHFPLRIIVKLKYIYAEGKGTRQITNPELELEDASFQITKGIISGGVGGEIPFFENEYSPFLLFDLLFNAIGETKADIKSPSGIGDFTLQKKGRRIGAGIGLGFFIKDIAEDTDLELSFNYNFLNMIGQEHDEGNIYVFNIGAFFLL
ncbi:MAG: hypothetical protein PVH88_02325 [Ignavibacteria bacterium]|jgi:hypothetical protein